MFARHLVHIMLGVAMAGLFTWSLRGIAAAILAGLVSQVVAYADFYGRSFFRKLSDVERATRDYHTLPATWSDKLLLYLLKAAWYAALTLVVAHVARSQGVG